MRKTAKILIKKAIKKVRQPWILGKRTYAANNYKNEKMK